MHFITIQFAADKELAPKAALLRRWAKTALEKKLTNAAELTIRIVDVNEMTHLNSTYRQKTGPTNVLSFPADIPEHVELEFRLLGDIIICPAVVNREAEEQHKPNDAHWAHMVVHGVFHLLGYDHVLDDDARTMEALEIDVLNKLGYANPYEIKEDLQS